MKRTTVISFAVTLSVALGGSVAQCAVNDYNPFNAVYGLSAQHQKVVKECIDEGEKMVGKLRQNNRAADADELSAMLSALRSAKYSNGFSVYEMGNSALQATGLSSVNLRTYAYVYSGFQQTIHLTGSFYDIDQNKVNFAGDPSVIRSLIRLEQLSVLLHEWKHTDYQGMLDLGRPESEAYATQLKWLKVFVELTPSLPGLSWDDLELPSRVETYLKNAGISIDQGTSVVADTGNSVDPKLPPPPAAETAGDIARINDWRKQCLDALNPDTDPARAANRVAALARADAIHANGERFNCRNCKVEVAHWWTSPNQWQCPRCELCTFITDQPRGDGRTFGEFAQARIQAIAAKRKEVEDQANALIAKVNAQR